MRYIKDPEVKLPVDAEYKTINTRDLRIDALYQREIDGVKLRKIKRHWSDYLVNPIKVSFRNGRYYVFDGQHTMLAMKERHNGDCNVECKVFYGLTELDEMKLFLAQRGEATEVRVCDQFRAMYNQGEPEIVDMIRRTEAAGWRCDFKKTVAHGRIVAYAALYRAYATLNPVDFQQMMSLIWRVWQGQPESVRAEMLAGMSGFFALYNGEFNAKRLETVLKRTSPIVIVRDAKTSTNGGNRRYVRQILNLYNSGLKNKLEDRI